MNAHLRAADRNPIKRAQHLKAADHYAQRLGVEVPAEATAAEQTDDPLSVRVTRRTHKCHTCKEPIRRGQKHLDVAGAFKICEPCFAGTWLEAFR